MSNRPYPVSSFGGGLNIRDKSDAVDPTEAIDLLMPYMESESLTRLRKVTTMLKLGEREDDDDDDYDDE